MSNFDVIIPARMQSTRLPHKMTLDVCGVPLIVRTALQAKKSKAKSVVVATDHEDIVKACKNHDINVVLTDVNHHSGTDRIKEAAELLKLADDEIVINVQGDEPLIEPQLINNLAEFLAKQKTPIATIAHPITTKDEIFNPHIVKVVLDQQKHALYFSRSVIPFYRDGFSKQGEFQLPQDFHMLRHIGIYAYSVEFLHQYNNLSISQIEKIEALEQLRALYHGYKISVLEVDHEPATGVDTLADLQRVRNILQHSSSS